MRYDTVIHEPSKGSRKRLPDGRIAVAANTHAVLRSVYYEIEGGNGAGGWVSWLAWSAMESAA